ncbi:MAG TPA: HNH endonuclease [Candidatus Methylomirabilis sp.]|nr:HNH endonuclease [Candidatus Methylomirabilis sp.]
MSAAAFSSASPDWDRWLSVLSNLHYDPASGVAPHKPLLILVVCDLVEEGRLTGAILHRNGDLAFRFSSYWRIVAERRRTKPEVRLPFFHLRTEGVWKPLEADGRTSEDRNRAVLAQMDVSFLICLSDPDFRALARRTLIAKYFEPQERAELYSLVGLEVPPEDIVAADATRFPRSKESEAKRDAKFSVRVLPAYDYTCALTRYRMIAIDGTTPLDAAHIRQFKKGGSNHPTNGLALSKSAHWLFDHGFWSITRDLRVIVAGHRFEEAGEDAYLLKKLAGRELLRPANPHFLPDPTCLDWHRRYHKFDTT